MSDAEASNALVATVRFYSEAFARSEQARLELEKTVRRLIAQAQPKDRTDEEIARDRLADIALEFFEIDQMRSLEGSDWSKLSRAVADYNRVRKPVGRVEPSAAREGEVRGAEPGGDAGAPG